MSAACEAGRTRLVTYHELAAIEANGSGDRLKCVTLRDTKTKQMVVVDCDAVLPDALGSVSDIGAMADWGSRWRRTRSRCPAR